MYFLHFREYKLTSVINVVCDTILLNTIDKVLVISLLKCRNMIFVRFKILSQNCNHAIVSQSRFSNLVSYRSVFGYGKLCKVIQIIFLFLCIRDDASFETFYHILRQCLSYTIVLNQYLTEDILDSGRLNLRFNHHILGRNFLFYQFHFLFQMSIIQSLVFAIRKFFLLVFVTNDTNADLFSTLVLLMPTFKAIAKQLFDVLP